jgi:hypothetical protein
MSLVSLQSPDHAKWLVTQVQEQKPSYCPSSTGVLLGYTFGTGSFKDLKNPAQDISHIFQALAQDGWIGYFTRTSDDLFVGLSGWTDWPISSSCTVPTVVDWPSADRQCSGHNSQCTGYIVCEAT